MVNGHIILSSKEIASLLEKRVIEGPVIKKRFENEDFWRRGSGCKKCYKEALNVAEEKNLPVICCTYDIWVMGKATFEYEFYRFVF